MSKYRILKSVILKNRHRITEKTRHFVGKTVLPRPYQLKIAKYDNDEGYYLFYCDRHGEELTDTYHETIEKAELQASWEFCIDQADWTDAE